MFTKDEQHEEMSLAPTTAPITPSAKFDVLIRGISLQDQPATLQIDLEVAGHAFFSRVIYHSIPAWQALWDRCATPGLQPRLLGALVAWEAMRFLALGGERVILCPGLQCDEQVRQWWTYCFRHQLGEWRYLNQLRYASPLHPELVVQDESTAITAPQARPPAKRALLTNGGGKDTLAGMTLLKEAGVPFDLYEGYLPIGNNSIALQEALLQRLKTVIAPTTTATVKVTVEDNFFSCSEAQLAAMGVEAQHTKIDFAVGHTANYIGYFPVILYHGYTDVWFNIERSADNVMVDWAGEAINHQWCKSVDYQRVAHQVFAAVTQADWFHGFSSTLRGLYDTSIYAIVAQHPTEMLVTHSCNYGKPWCNHCLKCCFCYLMMCAHFDEAFAQAVVGSDVSLFAIPENRVHWAGLLDSDQVAWECVPSHAECQLAAYICWQKGLRYPVLLAHMTLTPAEAETLWQRYTEVDWALVPTELHAVLTAKLACAPNLIHNEQRLAAAD